LHRSDLINLILDTNILNILILIFKEPDIQRRQLSSEAVKQFSSTLKGREIILKNNFT